MTTLLQRARAHRRPLRPADDVRGRRPGQRDDHRAPLRPAPVAMPTGIGVIDTMVGFPTRLRSVRLHAPPGEGQGHGRGLRVPGRVHVQGGAQGAVRHRRPGRGDARRDGPRRRRAGHGRVRHRGRPRRPAPLPRPVHRLATTSTRTAAWTSCAPSCKAYETLRHQGLHRVPRRLLPAGADQRPALLPGLRQVLRARPPDLRVRRRAGAAGAFRLPARRAHRRRDVRLPRAHVRHPPRLRAVDGAGREADGEVAQPPLLDVGVRAEALPAGR